MDLEQFLSELRAEINEEIRSRLDQPIPGSNYPYPELVFSEIVTRHMEEAGMTFEPQPCHFESRVSNAITRLSAYSVSEDAERLDLFVTVYRDAANVVHVPDADTKMAAQQCMRFVKNSAEGKMTRHIDPSNEAYELAQHIERHYTSLEEIRIYVLTDGQVKTKNFATAKVSGKDVRLDVMDIERLYRHTSEGKPRDELIVDFSSLVGDSLPCVYIPGSAYDYALTVIPGDVLYYMYEKYGSRLLEANVRSFLSATGKVNKGIQATLRSDPKNFVAFNNGIVMVADEATLSPTSEGGPGISGIRGMQIVNGGQTTASIYFTKKKYSDVDLKSIFVPTKLVVLKSNDDFDEESMISDISKYANSQNAVKQSDLSANSPFHVGLEKVANTVYLPDGVGRWFYERTSGSYNTHLAREGSTPAKLKHLKTQVIPPARRINKTDLAKFLNAWAGRPELSSLGGQKNFSKFMDFIHQAEQGSEAVIPDPPAFKEMIAKVIIFKQTQSLVRSIIPAFQGNVTIYLISLLAMTYKDNIDFQRVWLEQGVSNALKDQLRIWAREVNDKLHSTSNGRMISEWAKREECWEEIRRMSLTAPSGNIPELRL